MVDGGNRANECLIKSSYLWKLLDRYPDFQPNRLWLVWMNINECDRSVVFPVFAFLKPFNFCNRWFKSQWICNKQACGLVNTHHQVIIDKHLNIITICCTINFKVFAGLVFRPAAGAQKLSHRAASTQAIQRLHETPAVVLSTVTFTGFQETVGICQVCLPSISCILFNLFQDQMMHKTLHNHHTSVVLVASQNTTYDPPTTTFLS